MNTHPQPWTRSYAPFYARLDAAITEGEWLMILSIPALRSSHRQILIKLMMRDNMPMSHADLRPRSGQPWTEDSINAILRHYKLLFRLERVVHDGTHNGIRFQLVHIDLTPRGRKAWGIE
ncbi:MAG: hypothetical protein KGJ33_01205 [Patescibacteria group bacterium]|nr:hypothetical protein [Patescibacteria group bacterium]